MKTKMMTTIMKVAWCLSLFALLTAQRTLAWRQEGTTSNDVIDQKYYSAVLPILDRQRSRFSRYLDAVLAPDACPAR
jgi:hypothetical protein